MPKLVASLITLAVAAAFSQPGLSHDDCTSDRDEFGAAIHVVVDNHVCTDEYDKAMSHSTLGTTGHSQRSVVESWDGTPFVVNVSSEFGNADELMDVVEDEADRIRHILGYRIFVPGNVLPLPRVESRDNFHDIVGVLTPPTQQLHVICCDEGIYAGYADALHRLIVLNSDEALAEGAILHELYHLFGFGHPGEGIGVPMSSALMWDVVSIPTAQDMAGLACIFDGLRERDAEEVEATPALTDSQIEVCDIWENNGWDPLPFCEASQGQLAPTWPEKDVYLIALDYPDTRISRNIRLYYGLNYHAFSSTVYLVETTDTISTLALNVGISWMFGAKVVAVKLDPSLEHRTSTRAWVTGFWLDRRKQTGLW